MRSQGIMDNTISFEEVAALVANPPSLAPRPNFTNLRNLRRHIQRALQRLSCPQSNILGWAGLIMARSMYSLLTTSPFLLPSVPGPMAIYYPPPVEIVDAQGDPVLDAEGTPRISIRLTSPELHNQVSMHNLNEQIIITSCF